MPSNRSLGAALASSAALLLATPPRLAHAQPADAVVTKADRVLAVTVGSSTYLKMGKQVSRVAVGDAQVAQVTAFDPDQLLISGLRPGRTTATIWVGGEAKIMAIEVGWPVDEMRAALKRALPAGEDLDVQHAGRAIILSGKVTTPEEVERAERIVGGIAAGVFDGGTPSIVNAMTLAGAQQVQLEVSFAEVSRSSLREIGFNFWSKNQYASKDTGYAGGLTAPGSELGNLSPQLTGGNQVGELNHGSTGAVPLLQGGVAGAFGFVFSSTLGGFPFSAALSLLSSRGYSRTLAEPSLVAMSGKSARFLAGGEFPVPLPQALGQLGIEYRKFGIQLMFTPTVSGDEITLELGVTASDVDASIGVRIASTQVPGLRERHSETTVRLTNGQSFVIAGLISDEVRSSVAKLPLLGSIPVLGALFRSSSYQRQETELLVVVTAHLVEPLDQRPPLPGENTTVDPDDLDLFLLGRTESIGGENSGPAPATKPRKSKKTRRSDDPVGALGFKR